MSIEENCTLIIESEQKRAIETAYKRANDLFGHVSPINFTEGGRWYTFVVVPEEPIDFSKNNDSKMNDRQIFVDWCESENEKSNSSIYFLKSIKH